MNLLAVATVKATPSDGMYCGNLYDIPLNEIARKVYYGYGQGENAKVFGPYGRSQISQQAINEGKVNETSHTWVYVNLNLCHYMCVVDDGTFYVGVRVGWSKKDNPIIELPNFERITDDLIPSGCCEAAYDGKKWVPKVDGEEFSVN